jgi:hypothetical protein
MVLAVAGAIELSSSAEEGTAKVGGGGGSGGGRRRPGGGKHGGAPHSQVMPEVGAAAGGPPARPCSGETSGGEGGASQLRAKRSDGRALEGRGGPASGSRHTHRATQEPSGLSEANCGWQGCSSKLGRGQHLTLMVIQRDLEAKTVAWWSCQAPSNWHPSHAQSHGRTPPGA